MSKIAYIDKNFRDESLGLIGHANTIIDEYQAQGFDLTLRQLYYQFVARDLIPNTQRSYKRLGGIINDARLAGHIDWEAIVDRTRNRHTHATWDDPAQIIRAAASSYKVDLWETQIYRPEVWIEKEALIGVIEGVCKEFQVPYYACRGYNSQSQQWRAAVRAEAHEKNDQQPIIFYFGDHDPSGMDMPRDLRDRFKLFIGGHELERIALNKDQVDEYSPPPNPTKLTDSRSTDYIQEHGDSSWELDALDPPVIAGLIRKCLEGITDPGSWDESLKRQAEGCELLDSIANEYG